MTAVLAKFLHRRIPGAKYPTAADPKYIGHSQLQAAITIPIF